MRGITPGLNLLGDNEMRTLAGMLCLTAVLVVGTAAAEEKVLFDFTDAAQVKAWSMWQAPKPARGRAPKPEPQVTLVHANGAMRITYAGGLFPTIVTKQIPSSLDSSMSGSFEAWPARAASGDWCQAP